MYFKIEKSGCCQHQGLCQVRYDLFLEPEDYGYDQHYVQVPIFPEEGYPDQEKLDTISETYIKYINSLPVNEIDEHIIPDDLETQQEYIDFQEAQTLHKEWYDKLPLKWQNNPFCCHFCFFEPNVNDEEILWVGEISLAMQYKNWSVHKDLSISINQPVEFIKPDTYDLIKKSIDNYLNDNPNETKIEVNDLTNIIISAEGIDPALSVDIKNSVEKIETSQERITNITSTDFSKINIESKIPYSVRT